MMKAIKIPATPGVRIQLSLVNLLVNWFIVQADPGNANNVYVGGADVDATHALVLAAGGTFVSPATNQGPNPHNLAQIYFDAAGAASINLVYEQV